MEQTNGRVPVIAGSGSNDTAFSVITSKEAASIGADALMSVTPYYNKTTQEGLLRHFYTIAESARLPLIVYNVPSRTGMDISLETCKKLAEHPLIAGIKEASGDMAKATRIIESCGEDLPVYSGNDDIAAQILSMGGKGIVSVVSNLLPAEIADLCRRGLHQDMAGCRAIPVSYTHLGLAATAVLLGSNIVISLLRKVIPDKVRIPSYIVIIAGFVTIVSFLLEAYVPDIYEALGLFLPLIVVNLSLIHISRFFFIKARMKHGFVFPDISGGESL